MKIGILEQDESSPLLRRLAWLTGLRLLFLLILLSLVSGFLLDGGFASDSFTARGALGTLVLSFALAGVYAAVLRVGRHLTWLAHAQLALDQLVFSCVVYLSGGPSSAAVSFYGVSCVVGAVLVGMPGAATAAGAGALLYLLLLTALYCRWLPAPPDQPIRLYALSADEFVYVATVNLLGLIVVMLLSGFLAERLRATGGQLLAANQRAEQAERQAALGRLTTGLAHEIRNPLSAISGSIHLLKDNRSLSEEDRQLCAIIYREARRLEDLVSDMMNLAKPRAPNLVLVDVAAIAREVVRLASQSGRGAGDVAIRFDGTTAVLVHADGAQLRQLVWNLVRNAVQASSPNEEVVVRVGQSAELAWLEVVDNGVGIDPEARERLFDAFFTTRSQGTGVGLAVVKRIADDHQFNIVVDSTTGRGATFRLEMPASAASASMLAGPVVEKSH